MGPITSLLEDFERMDVDQPQVGIPHKAEPQASVLPSCSVPMALAHSQSNSTAYVPAYLKMSAGIGRDWKVDLDRKPNPSLRSRSPIPDGSLSPFDSINKYFPITIPTPKVKARQPRKMPPKKLTKATRTRSQRSYTMISMFY